MLENKNSIWLYVAAGVALICIGFIAGHLHGRAARFLEVITDPVCVPEKCGCDAARENAVRVEIDASGVAHAVNQAASVVSDMANAIKSTSVSITVHKNDE
ncbi:MAG: hypothetical protein LBO08_03010 [Rickettsiales bacterium]|jgi:hypothetical protein|nr:hypothetical protein [Rickettsiales bacterium]